MSAQLFFVTESNANEWKITKKHPILISASYISLNFSRTQLHEPKIYKETISVYLVDGVVVFSGEILLGQRSLVY